LGIESHPAPEPRAELSCSGNLAVPVDGDYTFMVLVGFERVGI
jgi:hypothetical protein